MVTRQMGGGLRLIFEDKERTGDISQLLSRALPETGINDADVRMMNPLALAYVGDTVHDIFVRTHLASHTKLPAGGLHRLACKLVCAEAQATAFRRIEPCLREAELSIYKRGRNAGGHAVPKNADMADYRAATGLEALWGYLYLSGQDARLAELLSIAIVFDLKKKEANNA